MSRDAGRRLLGSPRVLAGRRWFEQRPDLLGVRGRIGLTEVDQGAKIFWVERQQAQDVRA